ncbi:LSU ribosomal protein L25p [hydrothermal vent metagenome]|uniref:LSU ribosomal protein L25p n=1 Tax=hydrothermal vent metagenome TaxID=652676 RepID=A0A3B0TBP7_9ZZZZ
MKLFTIKGSKRESVGKVATKALRNAGKVPCVLYGEGEPIHFSASELTFKPLVFTPNIYISNIDLGDDKTYETILQDIQFHPVTERILHIDFYQLKKGKELTLDVPIKIEGSAIGVKNGGAFIFSNRKVSITSIPKNIPDFILVNIENLDIENSFSIQDLEDVEDLVINHSDDFVICRIAAPMAEIVEEVVEEELAEGEGGATTEGEEGTAEGGEGAGEAPKAEEGKE